MSYRINPIVRWSVAGVVFMLVGIPFVFKQVPPNSYSGFRVGKTFSDERIWYAANQVMGYDLLLAGAVIVLVTFITARLTRNDPHISNRVGLVTFVAALAAAVAHSFWALGRL